MKDVLTNVDLEQLFARNGLFLVGVFSKDQLPYKNQRVSGCYIVNLQDEYSVDGGDNAGTHWVCFFLEGKKACYMDPFGVIMPRQVQEFLSDLKPYPYNQKQIQDIESEVCGWYCLYFCWWMLRQKHIRNMGDRLNRFCELWSDDPRKNESLLKKYIQSLVL